MNNFFEDKIEADIIPAIGEESGIGMQRECGLIAGSPGSSRVWGSPCHQLSFLSGVQDLRIGEIDSDRDGNSHVKVEPIITFPTATSTQMVHLLNAKGIGKQALLFHGSVDLFDRTSLEFNPRSARRSKSIARDRIKTKGSKTIQRAAECTRYEEFQWKVIRKKWGKVWSTHCLDQSEALLL